MSGKDGDCTLTHSLIEAETPGLKDLPASKGK
jgi:hypothetical protein